jgi:hypothetical protein
VNHIAARETNLRQLNYKEYLSLRVYYSEQFPLASRFQGYQHRRQHGDLLSLALGTKVSKIF